MGIQPEEAWKNNVLGTKNVAELLCIKSKILFLSHRTRRSILETFWAQPKIGELLVRWMVLGETKFVVVRFGNVLGSRGSWFLILKDRLRQEDPLPLPTLIWKDL